MGITRFAVRRLALAIPTVLGLLIVTFLLANFLPGDSLSRLLGDRAASNPEIVARYRAEWGLDGSLPERFWAYLTNLVTGDFGESTLSRRPVAEDLADYLPATLELAVAAILVAGTLGLGLGILAATFHRRWPDLTVRMIALVASGVPVFWLGLLLLQLLYLDLGVVPGPEGRLSAGVDPPPTITGAYTLDALLTGRWSTFGDAIWHLVLPSLVLGSFFLGLLARITRASMLDVLRAPYLVTARSKGLTPRQILFGHSLPNALLPTITILGLAVGGLLAGAVLTETVFSWPGIGRYAVDAAKALDYQAILGVTFLIGVIYVLTNALIDIVYAGLDPRIRLGS